jgi:dTDP-4-amino-4,6-dideoxygalactose transaminase
MKSTNEESTQFDIIKQFENELAEYTGAPYVIMTDCCTHAIELCLRHERPNWVSFTAFTYLSVLMLMHKLNVQYQLVQEDWIGEYRLYNTRIWDSARRLERGMYRPGMMQCLSFGHGKPLQIGRGGAILLDDVQSYRVLLAQRYDGRDLSISPWHTQQVFRQGYHYRPTPEEAKRGLELLPGLAEPPKYHPYPDLREIRIID